MPWKKNTLQILLLILKTAAWLFVGAVILFLLFFLPTFNRFRTLYASEMSAKTAIVMMSRSILRALPVC